MATIHLGPLQDYLDAEQIASLVVSLEDADVPDPGASGSGGRAESLDDDAFAELMDRVEANDAACDLYLPVDFEDVVEVAGMRVGSAHNLIFVLDEIANDLFTGDVSDDEDDSYDSDDEDFTSLDEDGYEADDTPDLKEEQMRLQWDALRNAAEFAIRENLGVLVQL